MNDHLLAEALRKRDPGSPAAMYDAHADRLHAYCWLRLRSREAARVALRDTFISAEAHIGRLRDPARFRAWLFAVARVECARRPLPDGRAPDVPVADHGQEDVDQRMMAWRTVMGLTPAAREILDLKVRHELPVPDLAAVLGMSPGDVQEELEQAHGELEEALTAEILAHRGPYGCVQRALLLKERRGGLGRELNGRLTEHAKECSSCGGLRPRSVSAAKVFGLLPDVGPETELRTRVMSCFLDPELVGYRTFAAKRVTEFGPDGFPVQADRAERPVRASRPGRPPGIARVKVPRLESQAVRAGAVLGVVALLSVGGVASFYGIAGKDSVRTLPSLHPTVVPEISQTPRSVSTGHLGRPGSFQAAPVSATFPLGVLASSAPPFALPEPSVTEDERRAPGAASKEALTVSPLYLDLAGESDGSVEVRAEGAPISWRATTRGPLRVQPSSGRLEAGQAVTVRVHVSRQEDEGGSGVITFQPGTAKVNVTWRAGTTAPEPTPSPTPTGTVPGSPSTPPSSDRPGTPPPVDPTPPPSSGPPPSSDPDPASTPPQMTSSPTGSPTP